MPDRWLSQHKKKPLGVSVIFVRSQTLIYFPILFHIFLMLQRYRFVRSVDFLDLNYFTIGCEIWQDIFILFYHNDCLIRYSKICLLYFALYIVKYFHFIFQWLLRFGEKLYESIRMHQVLFLII